MVQRLDRQTDGSGSWTSRAGFCTRRFSHDDSCRNLRVRIYGSAIASCERCDNELADSDVASQASRFCTCQRLARWQRSVAGLPGELPRSGWKAALSCCNRPRWSRLPFGHEGLRQRVRRLPSESDLEGRAGILVRVRQAGCRSAALRRIAPAATACAWNWSGTGPLSRQSTGQRPGPKTSPGATSPVHVLRSGPGALPCRSAPNKKGAEANGNQL